MFDHVKEFADALDRVRRHAGLSYRELAARAHYSHPHLIRATSGKHLPTWDVTAAFLTGCGVPPELQKVWRRRWDNINRGNALELLQRADSREDLGKALATLAGRRSLRDLEQLTGVPRTSIQAWFSGTRRAHRDRLDTFVRTLNATPEERRAVAEALDRVSSGRSRVAPAA
ncbi:helix-turn-helix protein [Kribbella antiqua]|uniref:Helix-turn-helix protein n=1 Tax=Kribbella antiqua TaxID=2512217 RepID=A0A4R2IGJ2_9ACTN|nr:helix-turn-helix protein [Kribbella antiqua]